MSSLDKPLVTVVIPVFNRARLLREAVASVLAQTWRPLEVIIVDDGSSDDTPAAIGELLRAHPALLRAHRTANGGPGPARQAGLSLARGSLIQFLDSDDLLLPDKLALQVEALQRQPDCGVAYGRTRYYRIGEEPAPQQAWKRTGERIATMLPSMLRSRWWGTSTPLYRADLCRSAGPFTSLRNEEDWEFDVRVGALGTKLAYVDAFVSEQRAHGGDRLSAGGTTDPAKLRDRARAHELIHRHAVGAGIGHDVEEMRHFARELFLLARTCGAAGLANEAAGLFELARAASGRSRGRGLDFRIYGALAGVAGWTLAGRLACGLDRWRSGVRA